LILALVLIESMALYTFAIAASLIFGISRLKIG
jgi:F0F1-type ATP synthase membrane subunit c/vacuolar-type H+-ATPase subunit K